jgi:hypothetical protein
VCSTVAGLWASVRLSGDAPPLAVSGNKWLVLPERIELSTSPLPRECSTTELRQRPGQIRDPGKGGCEAARTLPQGPQRRNPRAVPWRGVLAGLPVQQPSLKVGSAKRARRRGWRARIDGSGSPRPCGRISGAARRRTKVGAGRLPNPQTARLRQETMTVRESRRTAPTSPVRNVTELPQFHPKAGRFGRLHPRRPNS